MNGREAARPLRDRGTVFEIPRHVLIELTADREHIFPLEDSGIDLRCQG